MWTHRGKTDGEANLHVRAWQVPTPRRSVLKESAPLEDPDEDLRYTWKKKVWLCRISPKPGREEIFEMERNLWILEFFICIPILTYWIVQKRLENEFGSDHWLGELQKERELILTIILYLTIAVMCVLLVCAIFWFEGLIIHWACGSSPHSPPIFIFQVQNSEVSLEMMWARICTFLRKICNSVWTVLETVILPL